MRNMKNRALDAVAKCICSILKPPWLIQSTSRLQDSKTRKIINSVSHAFYQVLSIAGTDHDAPLN